MVDPRKRKLDTEASNILKRRGVDLKYDWSVESRDEILDEFFERVIPGIFHRHSYMYERPYLKKAAKERGVEIKFFPYNSRISHIHGDYCFLVLSKNENEPTINEVLYEFDPESFKAD
jgi:hypothetical protein